MYKRKLNTPNILGDAEEAIYLFSNSGEEYTTYLEFVINGRVKVEFSVGYMNRK